MMSEMVALRNSHLLWRLIFVYSSTRVARTFEVCLYLGHAREPRFPASLGAYSRRR